MADPVDPAGLETHKIIGRSSNQELLVGPPDLDIRVDDFVFLRPHQSEAVFLQFGDIAVHENGAIVDTWPVFPASA
jgi:D-serine deaminase-like pyridoxal phosphate-dependent protein